jgi:cytochrome c
MEMMCLLIERTADVIGALSPRPPRVRLSLNIEQEKAYSLPTAHSMQKFSDCYGSGLFMRRAGIAILLVIAGFLPMSAKSDDLVNQGGWIAKRLCSQCHAISGSGPSPVAAAPIFSTIGRRTEIVDLPEALAEGILTGHGPTEMPEFVLTPDEIDALLAYLHSVQK